MQRIKVVVGGRTARGEEKIIQVLQQLGLIVVVMTTHRNQIHLGTTLTIKRGRAILGVDTGVAQGGVGVTSEEAVELQGVTEGTIEEEAIAGGETPGGGVSGAVMPTITILEPAMYVKEPTIWPGTVGSRRGIMNNHQGRIKGLLLRGVVPQDNKLTEHRPLNALNVGG